MDKKASPDHPPGLDPVEEAMARARLKRMRARHAARPPKPLGMTARAITRKHLKGTGTPLAKLRDDWSGIVGERLGGLCRPEKLSGSKTARTLTVKVLPAAAALIQHESETIRQRVSVAAGGNITRLKLVQGSLGTGRRPPQKPSRKLTIEEHNALEASASGIENSALKAAIVSLGRAVLTDET